MNERAQELLDGLPGFVFTTAGPVHVSGDLGLLAFHMGVPEQPPAVSGTTWLSSATDRSLSCIRS